MAGPLKALFYVQHLLGIGHLMRAGTVTRALEANGIEVTLVSGGTPVPGFESGASHFVQLPPTRAVDKYFKVLVDENNREIDDAWKDRRRDLLLDVYRRTEPDIVLVELYPFGRRQMRFEIEPLLIEARQAKSDRNGLPLIASSVRDILVEPDKPGRVDEMVQRVADYFDLVLVHGDPDFIAFDETFPRLSDIASVTRYTGYVADPPPAPGGPGSPGYGEVIVSTGGGAVSEDMLAAAIGARALTSLAHVPWRVLLGHNYPEADFQASRSAAPDGVIVERARTDFAQLLANCRLSISQGGYNTVMEILATGARAVCLPYAGGLESEQTLRCGLLAQRGAIEMDKQEEVSAVSVAAAVERALAAPKINRAVVNMDGAQTTANLLKQAVSEGASAQN
jgi:predicted glycosyltransferase